MNQNAGRNRPLGHIAASALTLICTVASAADWSYTDITARTGGPLPTTQSHLSGYIWPYDQSQHIIYVGNDMNIQEAWYRADLGWHVSNLTAGNKQPVGNSPVFGFAQRDTQNIIYEAVGAKITQAWTQPGGAWQLPTRSMEDYLPKPAASWKFSDGRQDVAWMRTCWGYLAPGGHDEYPFPCIVLNSLERTTNGGAGSWGPRWSWPAYAAPAILASTDITGFAGMAFAQYMDNELRLFDENGPHPVDRPAGTSQPISGTGLTSYRWTRDSSDHLIYVGIDLHVHELYRYGSGAWLHTDLTASASAPPAALDTRLTSWGAETDTQHVAYIGIDRQVHELWSHAGDAHWSHNGISHVAGAPTALGTQLASYLWPSDQSQHVVYVGIDSHVIELFQK